MAYIVSTKEKDCECSSGNCPTSATITKFSCGCVRVDVHNDTDPCPDCSRLSDMEENCSEGGGDPSDHDD